MPTEFLDYVDDYSIAAGNFDVFARLVNDPYASRADAAIFANIKAAMADATEDDFERNRPK